jgi:RNA-binding protein 39
MIEIGHRRSDDRKRSQTSKDKKTIERRHRRSKNHRHCDDKFSRDYSNDVHRANRSKTHRRDKRNCEVKPKDRVDKTERNNSSRHEEDFARNEKYREMKELERATRTVFVSNLHIKVNEKDLFILFSQKAGKILDIYVICDKHTNKSKGLAYVELETIESMTRALGLSGTEMYEQSIQVRPSEMEKNIQWTIQKQAQQKIFTPFPTSTADPALIPSPGVDIAAAATAAAKLLTSEGGQKLFTCPYNPQEDQRQRKIYIGNLPREIDEIVLRNMFEPFGAVESSNVIKDPVGKSQGYGFILFREKEVVEKAIQSMNGLLIGSNIIKVNFKFLFVE